jgi:hypothetical protein
MAEQSDSPSPKEMPSADLKSSTLAGKMSAKERLRRAVALKDYAVAKGIAVSTAILQLLNEAECKKDTDDFHKYLCEKGIKIDETIAELTNVTYPTTGDSLLDLTDRKQEIDSFKNTLWWLLLLVVTCAAGAYLWVLSSTSTLNKAGANILLALSLGLLGAVMFQVFNIIGIIKEKAFNIEDLYANQLRILVGPAIGLIVYLAQTQGGLPSRDKLPTTLQLLLPFLAGFSTKLTVGILEKLIEAAMMAFSIEDKRADILARGRRGQAGGAVPAVSSAPQKEGDNSK